MNLSMIVAMGPGREIGLGNRLLWHLPEDLLQFKALTMGGVLIMGRKTYQSIGKILPGRISIVLSASLPSPGQENCFVARSIAEVFSLLKQLQREKNFVIGGAQIYQLLLPYTSELHLSLVNYQGPADAYFPSFKTDEWEVCEKIPHHGNPSWEYWKLTRAYPSQVLLFSPLA